MKGAKLRPDIIRTGRACATDSGQKNDALMGGEGIATAGSYRPIKNLQQYSESGKFERPLEKRGGQPLRTTKKAKEKEPHIWIFQKRRGARSRIHRLHAKETQTAQIAAKQSLIK